ncbi:MAG: protein kinase [Chloroflexota bacterium]|nr:protein kinase [Chloroflexota bacterium]
MSTGPQQPPRHLGKYEMQTRLGHGGMAEVWKAFDPQLQRHVAIKLMRSELRKDSDFVVRFEREARLVASLKHPNIIKIHDLLISQPPETETPMAYMVMDYVRGQTLADYIRNTSRKGQFPSWDDIVYLFTLTSRALDYAHQRGMIHRDIKPANILLDQRPATARSMGEPILTDFGVARLQGVQSGTILGSLVGTPLYISPEQALGQPSDRRCDLYSLGVILYEITTGVPPFRGDTTVAIIMQHVHELPAPPTLINQHIPQAVSEIILKSIAKRPEDRFDSAMSMTSALAQALNIKMPGPRGVPNTASSPGNPASSPGNPASSPGNPPSHPSLTPQSRASLSLTPGKPLLNMQQHNQTPTDSMHPETHRPTLPLLGTLHPQTMTPRSRQDVSFATNTPVQPPASASTPPGLVPEPPRQPEPWFKRIKKRFLALIGIGLIVLIAIGLSLAVLLPGKSTPTPTQSAVVGQITFTQSGYAASGSYDQIQVDIHNVPAPPQGYTYYAWLVYGSYENTPSRWQLPYNNGNLHLDKQTYPGRANLISANTLFLVTKETTGSDPQIPSNAASRLYYAQVAPSSSYSFDVKSCPTGTGPNVCTS